MRILLPPPKSGKYVKAYGFLLFLLILLSSFKTFAQTVTSDKGDYSPGEVATITGSGWTQDQMVHVEFKEEPDYPDYHIYDVAVDANGTWVIKYNIEQRHLGVTFTVNAVGQQSGATASWIFTDGVSISITAGSNPACIGSSVTFTSSYTNGTTSGGSYKWMRNGSNIGGQTSSSLTITVAANDNNAVYQVAYKDAANNTYTSNAVILSVSSVSAAGPITGNTSVCSSTNNVSYSISAVAGATSYTWTVPTGASIISQSSDGLSIMVGWRSATAGNVTVTPKNSCGSGSPSTLAVTVTQTPALVITTPAAVCAPSKVDLTAAAVTSGSTLPSGTTLAYYTDAATTTLLSTPNAVAASGTYYIKATNGNCLDVKAVTVIINQLHSANFTYSSTTFCKSGPAKITPTITGVAGGTFSSTTGLSLNTNTGEINVNSSTAGNYTVTYAVSGTCPNSSTASVTITTAPLATFSYGASNYCSSVASVTAVLASGATAGSFSASPAGLTLDAATGTITPGTSTPGTYTVTNTIAASGSCGATSASTQVIINAIPTIIGQPQSNTKTVGQSITFNVTATGTGLSYQWYKGIPSSQTVLSGATNATYSIASVTTSNAADYYVVVSGTCAPAVTSTAAKLTINKADASSTITLAGLTPTYTGSALAATATTTVSGTSSFSFTYDGSATVPIRAGSYAVVATLVNANYSGSTSGILIVNQAPLTVTVLPSKKDYGQDNPAFEVSFDGFVNSENSNVLVGGLSFATAATKTSPVGTYEVMASGLTPANYKYTYIVGTLTVGQATTMITAVGGSFPYDGTTKAGSGTVTGVASETATLTPTLEYVGTNTTTYGPSANAPKDAGTYNVTATFSNTNYKTITSAPSSLTITPASNSITFDALPVKTYGDAALALAGTASSGQAVSFAVSGPATLGAGNTLTITGAGTVIVTASQGASANYQAATEVVRSLKVSPAPLTITAQDQTKTYGEAVTFAGTEFKASALVNGETLSSVTLTSGGADKTAAVKTYAITPSTPVGTGTFNVSNYAITYVDGTLTVGQATPTINLVAGGPYTYDTQAHQATATVAGVNNDVLTATLTYNNDVAAPVDAGSYAVKASFAGNTNYKAAGDALGTLTINKADAKVGVVGYSGIYDGQAHGATGTATGVGAVSLSGLSLGDSFTNAPGGTANWSFTNANYKDQSGSATITIGQAKPSVMAVSGSFVYTGDPQGGSATATGIGLPGEDLTAGLTLNYSGTTNDKVAYNSSTAPTAAGTYTVTATYAATTNYADAADSKPLTIGRATPTVKAFAAADLTYNATAKVGTGTATGVKNENLTPVTLTYAGTGTTTYLASTTAPTNAGDYLITASYAQSGNYNAAPSAVVPFTIGQATPMVTAVGGSFPYDGTAKAGSATVQGVASETATLIPTLSYAGMNSTTYGPSATAPKDAGTYNVTATFENTNYERTSTSATLTITQALLTLTGHPATRKYGDPNPDLTATYSGQQNGETFEATASSLAVAASPVGKYDIMPAITGPTLANYQVQKVNGTLTVEQAPLMVTTNPKDKVYGVGLQATDFSGTITGLKNDDNITADYSSTGAPATASVGEYSLVATLTDLGSKLSNYAVTNTRSTLKVKQAPLTITALPSKKVYGQDNPAFNVSYNAFVNGEAASVLEGALTFMTGATAASPAGTYDVMPGGLTSTNYAISFAKGTLTVGQAELIVTADNQKRLYGGANPVDLTVQYSGFVNGDTKNALGGSLNVVTSATPASPVGSYPIKASGYTSANYSFKYVDGSLTVDKAPLAITAEDKTKVYGQDNPSLTVKYDGFVNGESANTLGGTLSVTTTATKNSSVNTYPITASGYSSGNYSLTYKQGTLAITKAQVIVTATAGQSKVYGTTPDPVLTYSITTGTKVDGDNFMGQLARKSGEGVAAYAINLGTLNLGPNYDLFVADGSTFAITPKSLTASIAASNKVYDGLTGATATGSVPPADVIAGDVITVIVTNAYFDDQNVGTTKSVTATVALSGAAANNYSLTKSTASTTANITPAALTITATSTSRIYGDANPAFTGTYAGQKNGETFTVSGTTPATASSPISSALVSYIITPKVAGATLTNYTVTLVSGTLTITPAVLTITATNATRQYSDPNPRFTGTYTGSKNGETFTIEGSTTADGTTGIGSASVIVPSVSGSTLANYTVTKKNGTLTITNEDATVDYTGAASVATSCTTCSTATLTLNATLRDVTAYNSSDLAAGDIRTAKIRFLKDGVAITNTNATNGAVTDGNGWTTVGLVTASDAKTGTVLLKTPVDIGNNDALQYTIRIEVAGNYQAADETQVVNVYKPLNDFITGGGYLVPTQSSGDYAAESGRKTNFGFNVKYNKSGKSLQGNINTIFRRTEIDGIVHVYQIKGNAMTSLTVDATNTAAKTALFNGKANMQDITYPLAPVSLGGNLTLQVTMTDKGEPGTNDLIGITVYNNGGGILYSSNWTGIKTSEVALKGGNVVVNSGTLSTSTLATSATTQSITATVTVADATPISAPTSNLLEVFPTPMVSAGTIHFHTTEGGKAQVYVYNAVGTLVTTLYNAEVTGGQEYYLPLSAENMAEGVYSCRLIVNGKVENKRFNIQH
jgi:hypothetical protein